MGLCKRESFCTARPDDVNDLKQCITNAVVSMDKDVLARVWDELDYYVDVCLVTNGHTWTFIGKNLQQIFFSEIM